MFFRWVLINIQLKIFEIVNSKKKGGGVLAESPLACRVLEDKTLS